MSVSANGKALAVGYKTVKVYDLTDKKTDPEP
jgi:hypothetical protein